MKDSALVLLSGGQDSTTCLFWAKKTFKTVTALIIDYGQRHKIEIESAKKIVTIAGVPFSIYKTDLFSEYGISALLDQENISSNHKRNKELPASFLPGRNIHFITIAGVYAYLKQFHNIVTGVCQTDYSGYPDCRASTIASLQNTLSMGMDYDLSIHTPLMYLTKAETVKMAIELGEDCIEGLSYSHTCYEGEYPPCGKCPACKLREKGFKEANEPDPLMERAKREKEQI